MTTRRGNIGSASCTKGTGMEETPLYSPTQVGIGTFVGGSPSRRIGARTSLNGSVTRSMFLP